MDANDSEPTVKREIQTVSVGYSGEIISSINGLRMNDVLNLLKEKPELIDINSDHDMDEGYKKSLKEDQEFTI